MTNLYITCELEVKIPEQESELQAAIEYAATKDGISNVNALWDEIDDLRHTLTREVEASNIMLNPWKTSPSVARAKENVVKCYQELKAKETKP